MCTLVVSRQPDARCPLLVVAVRDEMLDREWQPPAHHWPAHPALVGGLDLLAGGSWLAVRPGDADGTGVRVGCVLNGAGAPAAEATRRSRGELPLLAAAGATLAGIDPTPYDPFHLILVTTGSGPGEVLSWDGHTGRRFPLGEGTHFFDNQGYWPGRGEPGSPRAERFGPAFAAGRPDPAATGEVAEAWRPWAELLRYGLLPPDDPRALLVRHQVPGDRLAGNHPPDRVAGSSSVTLLAAGPDLGPAGLRYDFTAHPEHPAWRRIEPAVGAPPELARYRRGMQGTVASYDADGHDGSALLDDGTPVAFDAAAFAASGLRRLRVGQRVKLDTDPGGRVVRVTLPTLP